MTQSWFKKAPTLEQVAVEKASATLDLARERRKSLLAHVIQKIEDIPLDERLIDLGGDLRGNKDK